MTLKSMFKSRISKSLMCILINPTRCSRHRPSSASYLSLFTDVLQQKYIWQHGGEQPEPIMTNTPECLQAQCLDSLWQPNSFNPWRDSNPSPADKSVNKAIKAGQEPLPSLIEGKIPKLNPHKLDWPWKAPVALSVFNLHSDGKKSITINYSLQLNTHYRIEFTVLKTINSISQLTKRTNHFTPLTSFFFYFMEPVWFKGKQFLDSKNNIHYRVFSLWSRHTKDKTIVRRVIRAVLKHHGSWSQHSLTVFFFFPLDWVAKLLRYALMGWS